MKNLYFILKYLFGVPLLIICFFWLAGIGFGLGITSVTPFSELATGRAVVISVFDLVTDGCDSEGCG